MAENIVNITKASGEREVFKRGKFCASLEKAGAPRAVVERACAEVEKNLEPDMETSQISNLAVKYLLKNDPPAGIRYNVKKGIMELGPAGFAFEQYIEAIVRSLGYHTKRNVIMKGMCVSHEIDVLAHKGDEHILLEMKYRNRPGEKTGVETVMYADARLRDIAPMQKSKEKPGKRHAMWLITNAKFTATAVKYGRCRSVKMTGWNFPQGKGSLWRIIADNALYPITIFPSVNRFAREEFARKGLILAHELLPYAARELERKFGMKERQAEKIIREVKMLFRS